MNVIETAGLGKCYGKSWALRDFTLADLGIPLKKTGKLSADSRPRSR